MRNYKKRFMPNCNFRSFIAIDIPLAIRQDIAKVTSNLRKNIPNQAVRWVRLENIHLTLRFLGEITEEKLGFLVEQIQPKLEKVSRFNVSVIGIGAFPNIHKARVLWMGLQISPDLLSTLSEMDAVIIILGIPNDHKFSPHLTIGRVNRNASSLDYARIESLITNTHVGTLGNFQVQSINIYKSDLTPNGPVYTRLYSITIS